jgi:hypothetical protein
LVIFLVLLLEEVADELGLLELQVDSLFLQLRLVEVQLLPQVVGRCFKLSDVGFVLGLFLIEDLLDLFVDLSVLLKILRLFTDGFHQFVHFPLLFLHPHCEVPFN